MKDLEYIKKIMSRYKTKQKIQQIDLTKSRLLADRRIYKDLGQQDLVDKTTAKIKTIREKKKELETLMWPVESP